MVNRLPLTLGEDAILGTPRGAAEDHRGSAGLYRLWAAHCRRQKYDDFNSAEVPWDSLKGKIVVYVNGGPADLPGPLKSYARTAPFLKAARDAGVVGLISRFHAEVDGFLAGSAWPPVLRSRGCGWLRHPTLPRLQSGIRSYRTTTAKCSLHHLQSCTGKRSSLPGQSHTFAELLALADAQKPLPRQLLAGQEHRCQSDDRGHPLSESPNIAAKLDGSDPKLKSQYVLVSAHLDHLGVGAPINGKTIYTGAMDDSSGVATVLEVAKKFSEAKTRPKRSMLFLVITAEEKGLLGSRYFAGHPTVPESDIKADLNLDMFMPIFPLKKLHVQGLEQSTLAEQAKVVGAEHSIEIAVDPEPDRNSFIRTDQYSFVQAGVPALAFKFGWTMGSPEYKAWRAWLAQRYHSTDDDLTQPVDLAAAAQFNSFLADLARKVADDPSTPHYLDSSFFKRFETAE